MHKTTSNHRYRLLGILAGLCAASIWGGMYVVSKVVLEIIPPFSLLTLRLILGAATLYLILWFKKITLDRSQIPLVLGVGFIGFGISVGLQFVGTKLSTASNGALVTSATPVFIVLFSIPILREKITLRRSLALVLSIIGVIAVVNPGKLQFSQSLFWGNISLVGAAITWALYSVLIRWLSPKLDTLQISFIAFLGGLFLSFPMAVWEINQLHFREITVGVLLGLVYLGVVSTALAMFLWNKAFAMLDASAASLTFFAQPVVGVGLGILLLGEKISGLFIAGGLMIVTGILLVATEQSKPSLDDV